MPPVKFPTAGCRNAVGDLLFHSRYPHRLPLIPLVAVLHPAPTFAVRSTIPFVQSRTILSFPFTPARKQRQKPATPPGVDVLNGLIRRLDDQIGTMPTREEILDAFKALLGFQKSPIPSDRVYLLLRCYVFLQSEYPDFVQLNVDPKDRSFVSLSVLRSVLSVLQSSKHVNHAMLARLVFYDMANAPDFKPTVGDLRFFVAVLCQTGNAKEAVDLCRDQASVFESDSPRKKRIWENLLKGLVKLDDEVGLLEMMDSLKGTGMFDVSDLYHHPVHLYSKRQDMEKTKMWFEKIVEKGLTPKLQTHLYVLLACRQGGTLEWGHEILRWILAQEQKSKMAWDVVLQWTAAVTKSVDKVDALLRRWEWESKILLERNQQPPRLTIDTFNALIKFSLSEGDLYMAERAITLLNKWNFKPDRLTHELKMDYRTRAGDLAGALAIFQEMKLLEDIPDDYSGLEIQGLLRALCTQQSPDIPTIVKLYKDMIEWKVQLEADIVIAILDLFLKDASFPDVTKVLNRHVGFFTPEDRQKVISEMSDYIHQSTTPVEAACDTYEIMRTTFPEMDLVLRQRFMNLFFELGQAKQAVSVFEHMKRLRPTKNQYIAALVGVGEAKYQDGVLAIHRKMSMDPYVEVDTAVWNALMYAHGQCGLFFQAFNIYEDIEFSAEGPNSTTIALAMDACMRSGRDGLERAKKIWRKFVSQGVKMTVRNCEAYIECLLVHDDYEEASDMVVHSMYQISGEKPGPHLYVFEHT